MDAHQESTPTVDEHLSRIERINVDRVILTRGPEADRLANSGSREGLADLATAEPRHRPVLDMAEAAHRRQELLGTVDPVRLRLAHVMVEAVRQRPDRDTVEAVLRRSDRAMAEAVPVLVPLDRATAEPAPVRQVPAMAEPHRLRAVQAPVRDTAVAVLLRPVLGTVDRPLFRAVRGTVAGRPLGRPQPVHLTAERALRAPDLELQDPRPADRNTADTAPPVRPRADRAGRVDTRRDLLQLREPGLRAIRRDLPQVHDRGLRATRRGRRVRVRVIPVRLRALPDPARVLQVPLRVVLDRAPLRDRRRAVRAAVPVPAV